MKRSSQNIHRLFSEFQKHYYTWSDIGKISLVALFRDGLEALLYMGAIRDPCAYPPCQLKSAWQVQFE
jgi:hypothetical protein